MEKYRKYMEPQYGEVSEEVIILPSEIMDMENPSKWREENTPRTAQRILEEHQKCDSYKELVKVGFKDTFMVCDGEEVSLRIYKPVCEKVLPVVIFYHGGGFLFNDISVYDCVTRYIACYGEAIVIAVDYRLAPEYKCPTAREDAYRALEWTYDHCTEFGGDRNRITVCGDSAGGNLATAVCILSRDRKGPIIKKQILIFPLTTFLLNEVPYSEQRYGKDYCLEYFTKDEPLKEYFGDDKKEAMMNVYNSPLLSDDLKNLPPVCFLGAECDPLLDQGLMYAAKLEDFGVPVTYYIYEGMIHGFLTSTYKKSFECLQQICMEIAR